jgi:D-xylose transport system substrate-binding protein
MRTAIIALTAVLVASGLTACDSDRIDPVALSDTPKIGVILPDSRSSSRWENVDRVALQAALNDAGVPFTIQNAQGDRTVFRTLAAQMLADGVTVLMITNLDAASGTAVLDLAHKRGATTIDYDRLTVGGGADYHVTVDQRKVGQLMGLGLLRCVNDRKATGSVVAQLDGSATDNAATLRKDGYAAVLAPRFRSGDLVKGPDAAVTDRDRATDIFAGMLDDNPRIGAVVAADDAIAGAAISVLRQHGRAGTVPVTGQDASVEGLRAVLAGQQCMTVYKPYRKQARAAAELAVALAKGDRAKAGGTVRDPKTRRDVPAVLLEPKPIFRADVKDVVADGFVTAADLCTPDLRVQCDRVGVK